jgi:phosphoglycolate phosphatase
VTPYDVAVLDMAGTTVRDDGLVEQAFIAAVGPDETQLQYVRDTMGESKIVVFTHLFDGDRVRAEQANKAFEQAYADRVADAGIEPIAGAAEAFDRLRANGIKVALTTGFAPATQTLLIDTLGWRDRVDLWLAPADAGRGRPYPDLALTALLRLGGESVQSMLVLGDTTADVHCGRRAGAGLVAGVATGAHSEEALRAAGADVVLPSVSELPGLLGI